MIAAGHSLNRLRPDLVPSDASSTSLGNNSDPEVIGFGRPVITTTNSNGNSSSNNMLRSSRRRQHLDSRKVVSAQSEDPHRRRYKLALGVTFVLATIINFAMDVTFQVRLTNSNC